MADHDVVGTPRREEFAQISAPLSSVLSDEFDGAVASLQITADVLLLAALGRAVERTLGAGIISVDIADGPYRGGLVALRCASARDTDATATLLEADRALTLGSLQGVEALPDAEVSLYPAGTAPVDLTTAARWNLRAPPWRRRTATGLVV